VSRRLQSAIRSSETSFHTIFTRRHILEDELACLVVVFNVKFSVTELMEEKYQMSVLMFSCLELSYILMGSVNC
jgi:hypothetical protein